MPSDTLFDNVETTLTELHLHAMATSASVTFSSTTTLLPLSTTITPRSSSSTIVRNRSEGQPRRAGTPVNNSDRQDAAEHDVHSHLCLAYRLHFSAERGGRTKRGPCTHHSKVKRSFLKTSRSVISFTIFPTNADALEINRMLWQLAHSGYYDSSEDILLKLTNKKVWCVGLPTQLFIFLSSVTLDELQTAIVDFLLLLHSQLITDTDQHALHNFLDQLHPPILARVLDRVAAADDVEPAPGRRADVLEQLVQLCFLTPWDHPVFMAYETHGNQTESGSTILSCMTAESNALHELQAAWMELEACLRYTGVTARGVTDALQRAVNSGKGQIMLQRASLVASMGRSESSMLSRLPPDVLDFHLVPWVLRRDIESTPPCFRIPSNRWLSMIEMDVAAQLLDDMRAAGLPDHAIHSLNWSVVANKETRHIQSCVYGEIIALDS